MNFDLLLYWMSHVATGSWASFKQSVAELTPAEEDAEGLASRTRVVLSDLGFAEFFVDGGRNWRVLPPTIGGICRKDAFLIIGARSPGLLKTLKSAAAGTGAEVQVVPREARPASVQMLCSEKTAKSIADASGIRWSRSLPNEVVSRFQPVLSHKDVPAAHAPVNWSVRSFDVTRLTWVDGVLPESACEFSTRFGERKHFFCTRKRLFIPSERREAVYISAAVLGVQLIHFNTASLELSVPTAAPLPEQLSRASCLCSGDLAAVQDGRFRYSGVSFRVACSILAALGQPVPAEGPVGIQG